MIFDRVLSEFSEKHLRHVKGEGVEKGTFVSNTSYVPTKLTKKGREPCYKVLHVSC